MSFIKGAVVGVLFMLLLSAGVALAAGPSISVSNDGNQWIVDITTDGSPLLVRINGQAVTGGSASVPELGPSGDQLSSIAGRCDGQNAIGPAIAEVTVNGQPAVVRVALGWTWPAPAGSTGCFAMTSQNQLDEVWPQHKAGFLAKFPNALVIGE